MLKIHVSTADITVLSTETLTAGRAGLQCAVFFSDDWDGLVRQAVFRGCAAKDVTVSGSVIDVPHECLAESGYTLTVGLRGENEDGTVVIPTVWAALGEIQSAAELSGEEGEEPTPSIIAQIQRTAENAEAKAQSVADAAERGDFDGATGPQGPKGDTGEAGPMGPQGPKGDAGASAWSDITGKPFERIGDTLAVQNGTLDVNIHEVRNDAGGFTTIIG